MAKRAETVGLPVMHEPLPEPEQRKLALGLLGGVIESGMVGIVGIEAGNRDGLLQGVHEVRDRVDSNYPLTDTGILMVMQGVSDRRMVSRVVVNVEDGEVASGGGLGKVVVIEQAWSNLEKLGECEWRVRLTGGGGDLGETVLDEVRVGVPLEVKWSEGGPVVVNKTWRDGDDLYTMVTRYAGVTSAGRGMEEATMLWVNRVNGQGVYGGWSLNLEPAGTSGPWVGSGDWWEVANGSRKLGLGMVNVAERSMVEVLSGQKPDVYSGGDGGWSFWMEMSSGVVKMEEEGGNIEMTRLGRMLGAADLQVRVWLQGREIKYLAGVRDDMRELVCFYVMDEESVGKILMVVVGGMNSNPVVVNYDWIDIVDMSSVLGQLGVGKWKEFVGGWDGGESVGRLRN